MVRCVRFPSLCRTSAQTEGGFTLIAIAALLLVLSVTVALILPNDVADEADRIRVTQRRMRMIEQALQTFSTTSQTHRILPCPARYDRSYSSTNFAREVPNCWKAATADGCDTSRSWAGLLCAPGSTVVAGSVPVATLNLPSEFMLDGWGNKFTYVVDTFPTTVTAGSPNVLSASYASPLQIYSVNNVQARDLRGNQLIDQTVQTVPALIISGGPNQSGVVSAYGTRGYCDPNGYDAANCDFDTDMNLYIADSWHREDGLFDDLVLPVLFDRKNCQPPVPCSREQGASPAAPTAKKKDQPENCVPRSYFGAGQ